MRRMMRRHCSITSPVECILWNWTERKRWRPWLWRGNTEFGADGCMIGCMLAPQQRQEWPFWSLIITPTLLGWKMVLSWYLQPIYRPPDGLSLDKEKQISDRKGRERGSEHVNILPAAPRPLCPTTNTGMGTFSRRGAERAEENCFSLPLCVLRASARALPSMI